MSLRLTMNSKFPKCMDQLHFLFRLTLLKNLLPGLHYTLMSRLFSSCLLFFFLGLFCGIYSLNALFLGHLPTCRSWTSGSPWLMEFILMDPLTNCLFWLVKSKLLTQISLLISCSCMQLSTQHWYSVSQLMSNSTCPKWISYSLSSFGFFSLIEPPAASTVQSRDQRNHPFLLSTNHEPYDYITRELCKSTLLPNLSPTVLTLTHSLSAS